MVVKGDGDVVWAQVIADLVRGTVQAIYDGGRVSGEQFLPARWDLAPRDRYMWASVQTVRGCSKHCSFCSVWRTDGQKPRQRASDVVIEEIVQLRRLGFRFIALADDNFYPDHSHRHSTRRKAGQRASRRGAASNARGAVRIDGEAR